MHILDFIPSQRNSIFGPIWLMQLYKPVYPMMFPCEYKLIPSY